MAPGNSATIDAGRCQERKFDVYRYRDGSPHHNNCSSRSHAAQALILRSCALRILVRRMSNSHEGRGYVNGPRPAESGLPVSTVTDPARAGERDRADTAAGRDHGPEAAEIRAREEVPARGDETREDQGPGESRVQEALETAAAVAEETG